MTHLQYTRRLCNIIQIYHIFFDRGNTKYLIKHIFLHNINPRILSQQVRLRGVELLLLFLVNPFYLPLLSFIVSEKFPYYKVPSFHSSLI